MAVVSSNIDIDQLLFVPAAGKYTDQDAIRVFQQQPIDHMPRYLVPRKHGRVLPPLLHYGWIIDLKRTFKLAKEQNQAFYQYIDGPRKPDYFTTCSTFIPQLMHDLGLPYDERVYLCQIGSGELNPNGTVAVKLGVSMGTNYTGHMSEENAKKLRDATAPGAEIKWYLDAKRWQWSENRRYRATAANEHEKRPNQYRSESTQTLPGSPHV